MKLSSNNAETMESLRSERNQYRILVDITNSVLAHLDMDGLISEVSKEIHRFFGLNHTRFFLSIGNFFIPIYNFSGYISLIIITS